ncbi:MAG: TonB-dependent receptor [Hyphomicrobiales bacterium]
MSSRVLRALILGCSALSLPLFSPETSAQETLALPEINVTAASPIRRRPARPPADAVTVAAPTAPVEAPPLSGTLPIVTDQFATVTVVPREEIQRSPGSTLGDVLFGKPGITGSSFAPGASSRPIIRGLDVNRVGIVQNGIGGGGVSDLGEDHFVPVNPLATNQIEVIRGPATLRYGSQSIGGVVSATDNRIPDALPCGPFSPLRPLPGIAKPPETGALGCTSVEARTALSTADSDREGGVLVDSGAGNFAFHADAFGRQTGDYRVPSYPYLTTPDPAELPFATQPGTFSGRQPNSQTRSNEASVGGSYLFPGGFAGIAYVRNNNLYSIPGADGEGHGTRIDAHQDKVMGKGEYRPATSGIEAIRYWWGYTDYRHNEVGFADATDRSTDGVRQIFTSKEMEGRAEIQLMPFNLRFAELTTAIGVQGGHAQLNAPSPDDVGSPINGLFDPNKNSRVAGYIFNEFKFSEATKAQIAGRIERVELTGTTPAFIPELFDLTADPAAIGPATPRNLSFTPKSVSVGLIQNLPWDLVGSATAQYVERAPKPAELFSRGGHDATVTFDIGNPNLKTEVAKSVEVGLRRAKGPFRFELTGYHTQFDGFIFRRLTGNTCADGVCLAAGDPAGPLELSQAIYSQRNATFRGGEFQFQWDTLPMWQGFWGVDGQYDIVRATFDDGTNVPRIPPQRVGGGVYFRNAEWLGRVSLLHAFAQRDIAIAGETPTGGYNLLKVEVSHTREFKNNPSGIKKFTVGVVGNNLLNDDIRNHVSYTKDQVLMPGAGVRAFASVKY